MDALDVLNERGYNTFEEVLPSGLTVTLQLPNVRDCIIAGGVPLPIMTHVVTEASKEADTSVSIEEAAAVARYQDELVRRAVVAIEGTPVEMTPAAVKRLLQDDYLRIVAVATRTEAVDPTPAPAT